MKKTRLLFTLLLASLAQPRGFGEGGAARRHADPPVPEPQLSEERVSLNVTDLDLSEVLRRLSGDLGRRIVADPNVEERVTVQLQNTPWREALQTIARKSHCLIVDEDRHFMRFIQPPWGPVEFRDAELRVVLELLATQSGVDLILPSDLTGTVNGLFRHPRDLPTIQELVEDNGFLLFRSESDSKEVCRVVHPDQSRASKKGGATD